MTLFTLRVVQQIQQETKHKDNISDDSRSSTYNSSQAQKSNVQDVFVNSMSRSAQSFVATLPDFSRFLKPHFYLAISYKSNSRFH